MKLHILTERINILIYIVFGKILTIWNWKLEEMIEVPNKMGVCFDTIILNVLWRKVN